MGAADSILVLAKAAGLWRSRGRTTHGWVTVGGKRGEDPSALEEQTLQNLLGSPLWFAKPFKGRPTALLPGVAVLAQQVLGLKGLKCLTISCGLTIKGDVCCPSGLCR